MVKEAVQVYMYIYKVPELYSVQLCAYCEDTSIYDNIVAMKVTVVKISLFPADGTAI